MTTVSVQPTTSEPNERDIPTMSQFADVNDCVLAREKWYQDRIESLQAEVSELRFECASKDLHIDTLLNVTIESLQAKLTIAVNTLKKYDAHDKKFGRVKGITTEALAEIKKIGE